MDEDEANEAAYCLLAMSRGKNNSSSHQQRLDCKGGDSSALSAALGHQTLMEQQPTTNNSSSTTSTTFSAVLSAAAQTSPNRNSSDAPDRQQQQKSPFMIARILTDLTRVRQNLFSVEPLKQPTSDQRNQSKHHHIPMIIRVVSICRRALMIFKLSPLYICLYIISFFFFFFFYLDAGQTSGSKLHHCTYPKCERTYGKSSHLKAHMRTHTGMSCIRIHTMTLFICFVTFFLR